MKTLFLALTMNVAPVGPVDILRFLRVPAIVSLSFELRQQACRSRCRRRKSGDWRRRSPELR